MTNSHVEIIPVNMKMDATLRCKPGSCLPGDYVVSCPLGVGAYGEVYQCKDVSGRKCAVKIMDKNRSNSFSEVSLISMLNHPYIIKPLGIEQDSSYVYMYMPIYRKYPVWSNFGKIIKCLLSTLAYIHSLNIMHADIKPSNTVWKSENTPVIIDFGAAVFVPSNIPRYLRTSRTDQVYFLQTCPYRAPEIWKKDTFTCNADIWSLGCTLFEFYTEDMLFPTDNYDIFLKMIPNIFTRVTTSIPNRYQQLLLNMLTVDSSQRPTASQLLGLPVNIPLTTYYEEQLNELVYYFQIAINRTNITTNAGVNAWVQLAIPELQRYFTDKHSEFTPETYAKHIAYILTHSSRVYSPYPRTISMYEYILQPHL